MTNELNASGLVCSMVLVWLCLSSRLLDLALATA